MYELKLVPHMPITAEKTDGGLELFISREGGVLEIGNLPPLAGYRFLVLDITTVSDMHLPISIGFYKEGAESPQMMVTTSSIPGVRAVMPIDFGWLDNKQVFKERTPGRMKTTAFGVAMEVSEVAKIDLRIREFYQEAKIIVHSVYLSENMPDVALKDPKPVVDEFGQVASRDWPGKTLSADEMTARLVALHDKALESKRRGMPFPERFGFSKWGGDASKKLTGGSGYFALYNDAGTWYLTDPEGYAFFSVGPDCVGTNTASVLTGIEKLYSALPDRGAYKDAYNKTEGHFGGASMEFIDYYRVNLIRVFGKDWFDAYCAISEYQMKEMGFNTIANWSDPDIIAKTGMAYVTPLEDFPTTKKLIFRDFPDVFSDEYAKNSVKFAGQMKKFAGDPRLVGYFMRNEPQWGFSHDINLAREMFRSGEKYESKRALWAFLLGKYGGAADISKAWGVEMHCENCLMGLALGDLPGPDGGGSGVVASANDENAGIANAGGVSGGGACEADLREFSQKMVERYVDAPAKALKAADPNHLNLGMRYASLSSGSMFMGVENIDVFSINCYSNKPRESDVKNILEKCGKPCMIGEYHHGSTDRGCFGSALRAAANSLERGVAYQYYTEQSAAMPSMLGCHYFCLGDEAALGRYDGECWVIGFVDVCQRPYEEMFDAAIRTHERIYAVKSGRAAPCATPPVEAPCNSY